MHFRQLKPALCQVMLFTLLLNTPGILWAQTAKPKPAATSQADTVRATLHNAWEAYQAGDDTKALSLFQQVLATPSLPNGAKQSVYELSGQVYRKQGQWDKAAEAFQNAITLYEADKTAKAAIDWDDQKRLGILYLSLGNMNLRLQNLQTASDVDIKALKQYGLLLKQFPGDEGLLEHLNYITSDLGNIIYTLRKQKNEEAALGVFNQIQDSLVKNNLPETKGLIEIYAHIALGYLEAKQYQQALKTYQEAHNIADRLNYYGSPNWAGILQATGRAAYSISDYPTAINAYRELLAYNKTEPVLSMQEALEFQKRINELSHIDNEDNYLRLQGKDITRWSDKTRTLNIYFEDGSGHPMWKPEYVALVKQAFQEWETVMHGRIHIAYTDNPKQYDVKVFWPDKNSTKITRRSGNEIKLGYNEMSIWGEFIAQNDIYLFLDNGDGAALNENELYNTCLHEIGHLLGIHTHSNNPKDIMYKHAQDYNSNKHAALSARDINTMNTIYTMQASITNPDGIHLCDFEKFRKKHMADWECMDAPVITLDFDAPNVQATQKQQLVCQKKLKPRDQIPIYMQF